MRRTLGLFSVACAAALLVASGSTGVAGARDAGNPKPSEVRENAEGILSNKKLREYLDEAKTFSPAATDAAEPAELPSTAGGASGYTRYVFREADGRVLTSLVEGPQGEQVRCQDPDLPCSYLELQELARSGAHIPEALGIDRPTLEALVAQLDGAATAVEHYKDPNTACAEGFTSDRTQTPNMGSHFSNAARITDGRFVPAEPEIIMYARTDGAAPEGQLGRCRDGVWEGEPLEAVAVAYILFTNVTDGAHPEAFAGDFDNWHVHYNLCRGAGVDSIASREECEAQGGHYYRMLGWMIHAWVSPDHDNDLGVFSMWNPTLWPVSDSQSTKARASAAASTPGVATFSIENFRFGTITVDAGEPVVIVNTDSVPHTVTAKPTSKKDKKPAFDSGVFDPGQNFEVVLDEPGRYSYVCALHPDMQGAIVVR